MWQHGFRESGLTYRNKQLIAFDRNSAQYKLCINLPISGMYISVIPTQETWAVHHAWASFLLILYT